MQKEISLSDAELTIMEILWSGGAQKARDIAALANNKTGWEKNTVYTMLKRLIDKGAVERSKPDFVCTAKVEKSDIRRQQTKKLLDKLYAGSAKMFLRAFIHEQDLSKQDLDELRRIIDEEK
jgi:BlaI family transcriptional regulator, penicillinase repressor